MPDREETATRTALAQADSELLSDRVLGRCTVTALDGRRFPTLGGITIVERIGQGGMGVVYRGRHPRLGIDVAVKVLPPSLEQSEPTFAERFEREARIAARVRSDHLVAVLDVDTDAASGCRFLVMELVTGTNGARWLRDISVAGRIGVPERDAIDVCLAAAKGLAAAHAAGVVHRDVKPGNVLIPFGSDGLPALHRTKLSDLGLARPDTGEESLTGTNTPLGTPGYMAPEQIRSGRDAGRPADVFGLGAMMYALLAGQSPFRADTPVDALVRTVKGDFKPIAEVRPDVSAATAALVTRCLAPEPSDRFADGAMLCEALEICRDARGAGSFDAETAAARVTSLGRTATPTRTVPRAPAPSRTPDGPVTATRTAAATARPAPPSAESPWGGLLVLAFLAAATAGVVIWKSGDGEIRGEPRARAVVPIVVPRDEASPATASEKPSEHETPDAAASSATEPEQPADEPATPPAATVAARVAPRTATAAPESNDRTTEPKPSAPEANGPATPLEAAQEFDLAGLAAQEDSFAAKQIRKLVAQFRRGDLAAAADVQQRLAQFYMRFGDAARARVARQHALALDVAVAAAKAPAKRADVPAPPTAPPQGAPPPAGSAGQPASPPPPPPPQQGGGKPPPGGPPPGGPPRGGR